LGRCMSAIEGSGAQAGSFSLAAAEAGGPQLRTTYLSPELFEAAAMEAVGKDLLEVRGELNRPATRHGCAGGCRRCDCPGTP
jgi:hypothetical protein